MKNKRVIAKEDVCGRDTVNTVDNKLWFHSPSELASQDLSQCNILDQGGLSDFQLDFHGCPVNPFSSVKEGRYNFLSFESFLPSSRRRSSKLA